jgi:hypothetical protein
MKKETLEEVAERLYPRPSDFINANVELLEQEAFEQGVKWQQERMSFDISEKWGEYRNVTNNEDAYLFMIWLKEQFKNY